MAQNDFITLFHGAKSVTYGNYTISVKRGENGVFHVYLNGVNVVSYTTVTECFGFIDGVENIVKMQTKCNVTEPTANK